MSRSNIRWAVIGALVICVLGVLILPQVDLPDFVLNSAGTRAVCLGHVRVDSPSCIRALPSLSSHGLSLNGFDTYRVALILERTNISLALKKISALRC